MSPLYYLRLFSASGVDAGDFLHGQLSADIVSLKPGEATLAAYCSPRGQVIAPVLVQRRETDWLLALEHSLAPETMARMARFILRARVKFASLDDLWLAGSMPDATAPGSSPELRLDSVGIGYTLTSQPPSEVTPEVHRWKQRELSHGLCWLQTETSERFLPQMLGLEDIGALNFSKGCYPGQEIIARARYLGKVKRRCVLLELKGNTVLSPGADCTLSVANSPVEGIVLESVCPDGDVTTVMVVAAVNGSDQKGDDQAATGTSAESKLLNDVETLSSGGITWNARRIARVTG